MPLNFDDIKQLPDSEKLKLIDALLESIDKAAIEKHLLQTAEEENILQEHWERYQSGAMKFDTWENVEKRLRDKAAKRQQEKNDL